MSTLSYNDLTHVVGRLPADVRAWARRHQLVIGGGFIREVVAGGQVQDIDVFGPSLPMLKACIAELSMERVSKGQRCRVHMSKNADTLLTENRVTVQAIHRWTYDEPQKVVNDFDFTVCAAVIYADPQGNWKSIVHPDFYADLAARRLHPRHRPVPGMQADQCCASSSS